MQPGPVIDHHDGAGGREAMLRWGPAGGPAILIVPPLFEEANRTRAMLTDVARRLAALGLHVAVPDLPAQGESILPTEQATLPGWRAAVAAAAARLPAPVHVVAVRAGALLDGEAQVASRWYLAPLSGAEQVRELERIRAAGGGEDYAGNMLSPELLHDLAAAGPMTIGPLRVVRLGSDPRPADGKLAGAPLWRATEPGTDDALQAAMAQDIAQWAATCAA